MSRAELTALAERVMGLSGADNAVDVLVECALHGCRPNAAGTKVIYKDVMLKDVTFLADDYTLTPESRKEAAAALLALAEAEQ
jgi:hypothetical protein